MPFANFLTNALNALESIPASEMPAFWLACASVVLSLVLIEGLLSVDNALGIAAMAAHLPKHQQKPALRWGLIGAYTFRGIALVLVAWLMHNPWVKWFGAIYLVYLACEHLQLRVQAAGNDDGVRSAARTAGKSFIATIASIELMDLSLSLDNVVAAVSMVNNEQRIPEVLHIWVVCLGVFIGIAALRLVAGWCIGIIERHPILGYTAFLLVGFVGLAFCVEMGLACFDIEWHMGVILKFCCIIGIVALSLFYEYFGGLRRVLHPSVYIFRLLCTGFARVVESIVMPWRLFRKKEQLTH